MRISTQRFFKTFAIVLLALSIQLWGGIISLLVRRLKNLTLSKVPFSTRTESQ